MSVSAILSHSAHQDSTLRCTLIDAILMVTRDHTPREAIRFRGRRAGLRRWTLSCRCTATHSVHIPDGSRREHRERVMGFAANPACSIQMDLPSRRRRSFLACPPPVSLMSNASGEPLAKSASFLPVSSTALLDQENPPAWQGSHTQLTPES
jgi:hypothetical protein